MILSGTAGLLTSKRCLSSNVLRMAAALIYSFVPLANHCHCPLFIHITDWKTADCVRCLLPFLILLKVNLAWTITHLQCETQTYVLVCVCLYTKSVILQKWV